MAREFTAYVITRNPDGEEVSFEPGDAVPEWATIGDHAATSEGTTQEVQTPEAAPQGGNVPNLGDARTEIVTPDYEEADEDDEDDEADELPPYEEWSKTDLRSEVDGRELDVPSKANKDELVAALQADDAEQE